MPMPFDPAQRQSALASLSKPPTVTAPQGIFGKEEEKGPDSEEKLQQELQMIEKAKLDGSMKEDDYLRNLHDLQVRWEAISPKPYFSKEVEQGPKMFGR